MQMCINYGSKDVAAAAAHLGEVHPHRVTPASRSRSASVSRRAWTLNWQASGVQCTRRQRVSRMPSQYPTGRCCPRRQSRWPWPFVEMESQQSSAARP